MVNWTIRIVCFFTFCINTPLFSQDGTLVKIYHVEGYDGYTHLIEEVKSQLQKTVNSDRFKQMVLNGEYNQTEGLSNLEVYQSIMNAHETKGPGETRGNDGVMEFGIRTMALNKDGKKWMRKCRKKRNRTIGKEGGKDAVIITCPNSIVYWSKKNRTDKMAAHFLHEYLHILGYSHKNGKSKSAVYSIARYLRKIIKAELKEST